MSDTPTTPAIEVEPVLPPPKEESNIVNTLSFICMLILIVGGFITGHGFLGVIWLVIKWILWSFLLLVVLASISTVTKTKPKSPEAQHALGWGMLVIAMLVF